MIAEQKATPSSISWPASASTRSLPRAMPWRSGYITRSVLAPCSVSGSMSLMFDPC